MTAELSKRITDQGFAAVAAQTAKTASRTLWDWVEFHHVDRLAVIALTLWLTFDVMRWAMDFAEAHADGAGGNTALIIGAVLGPWGLLQGALFKFYADSKAKCINGKGVTP